MKEERVARNLGSLSAATWQWGMSSLAAKYTYVRKERKQRHNRLDAVNFDCADKKGLSMLPCLFLVGVDNKEFANKTPSTGADVLAKLQDCAWLIEKLGGGVGENNFARCFKNQHWLLLELGGIARGHGDTEMRR
jgi:hypothetical protein